MVRDTSIPMSIVEARSRMMVQAVFFSCILYDQSKLVLIPSGESEWHGITCPTAMTDGFNLVMNLDFMEGLSVEERVFVFCHEIYHIMAMHPKRMRRYAVDGLCGLPFMPQLYNIAADASINKCLVESKIGKLPKDCVWIEKIGTYVVTGMETAEEIYEKFIEELPPSTKQRLAEGDKEGVGGIDGQLCSGKSKGKGGALSNDVIPISPDGQAEHVNEAQMKAAVASAAQQAKSQGTMPAGIKRFVDEFLEEQVSWENLLRNTFITVAGKDSTTWSKPNRRKIVSPGIYLPRRRGLRSGPVAAAVDTSGSVSQKELAQFMGELASILGDVRPEVLYLMWCDAQVDAVVELQDPEELRTEAAVNAKGGGGTSFIPPFVYMRDNDIRVDTFIYFTDGYGPFPAEDMTDCPVIWCISSDVVAPFGITIKITY